VLVSVFIGTAAQVGVRGTAPLASSRFSAAEVAVAIGGRSLSA
jgi:hypothetical protein